MMQNLKKVKKRTFLDVLTGFIPHSKRGSSAILLSVIVSGSVLATIFYNQQGLEWVLSSQGFAKQEWSDHFIKKYGITLGSYLVSNNLVLCREKGWGEEGDLSSPRCKWNDLPPVAPREEGEENSKHTRAQEQEVKAPADFNLTQLSPKTVERVTEDGVVLKQALHFKASIKEKSINQGQEVRFKITFDLVNWKESALKNLIGEIPESVCRNTNTWQIIPTGYCVPPTSGSAGFQTKCKESDDTSADEIDNSICEFIAEADQDHHIVLISIQLLNEKGKPQGELAHAGIRRPFPNIKVQIAEKPTCALFCKRSNTPNDNPGCRGDFQPDTNSQTATLKLKITNEGPGALYRLSLLRIEEPLPSGDSDTSPSPPTYAVTADVLKSFTGGGDRGKVLLPRESIEFEEQVECNDTFQYNFSTAYSIRRQTLAEWINNPINTPTIESSTSSGSINVHAQAYMTLSYSSDSLSQPRLLCMKENQKGKLVSIPGNCPNQKNQACGNGGTCLRAELEPRRGIVQSSAKISMERTTTILTTTVRYISPH